MCDRHNPDASMMDSSYIFLPVNFPSPSTLQLQYLETWNLDYWSAADADRSKPPSPAGLK